METIVQLQEVSKSFGGTPVIQGLSLEVAPGELLSILGPSGCGKTTTLRLVAGFERPDQGVIRVAGRVVADGHAFVPPEKRGVGMVFQDYALFPHLTVAQNVAFGLQDRRAGERVQDLLGLVGLGGLEGRYPHQLSGGQQQRVALARALAPQPPVILLDEPFSNLDADLRAQVRREVRQILKATRTAAIFVTHDQEEALAIADRVAVLHQGRLEQVGTPDDIYHRPLTRFVADFVGQADFLPALVTPEGLETELGCWAVGAALIPGQGMEVMVRPHDVGLVADPQGHGLVVAREFHGEENHYTVRLPSGREIHSTLASHTVFHPGDRVQVRVCIPEVVVFHQGFAAQAEAIRITLPRKPSSLARQEVCCAQHPARRNAARSA